MAKYKFEKGQRVYDQITGATGEVESLAYPNLPWHEGGAPMVIDDDTGEVRCWHDAVPINLAKQWRVGRSLGLTLYIGDVFIGHVHTKEQAKLIVDAVNERIRRRQVKPEKIDE